MERSPIGCDEEAAMAYMGVRPNIWAELKARKVVKSLRRGWYAYADLDAAIETLRAERDKVVTLPVRGKSAKEFKTPEAFRNG